MQTEASISDSLRRRSKIGSFVAFVVEATALTALAWLLRRSWGAETAVIAMFGFALLIPTVFALGHLQRETTAEGAKSYPLGFLVSGFLIGASALLLAFLVGDHGAAPVMVVGLFIQGLLHVFAARQFGRNVREV